MQGIHYIILDLILILFFCNPSILEDDIQKETNRHKMSFYEKKKKKNIPADQNADLLEFFTVAPHCGTRDPGGRVESRSKG